MNRIFVSIASYRDTECFPTLSDLFDKAAHPERIFVGVLRQLAPEDDEAYRATPDRPGQIRNITVDASESLGVCWARHRIQNELWAGEEYYLQIDSHTRFEAGWDETLTGLLERCPSPKPVLSTHPNRYTPPDQLAAYGYPILTAKRFDDNGILIPAASHYHPLQAKPEAPYPAAFVGAGFLFGDARLVREVPYDPYIYFQGEEISLSARLWTHGFDLFGPNEVVLYHDYTTDRGRRRHWSDHVDWPMLNRRSMARVLHLLGAVPSTDAEVLQELDRYGLGQARSLEAYQVFADVDFRCRRIGMRGSDGKFPPPTPVESESATLGQTFHQVMVVENRWSASGTRSGSGSTLTATSALREAFFSALREMKIRILLDAGCGDLNWIQSVTTELELYLGVDLVEAQTAANRVLFAHRKNHFFNSADLCHDPLPRADLILCRHTLTHLPNRLVTPALRNFRATGSRYLMATTFPDRANTDIAPGQWRPINLNAPPFSLPPPFRRIADGESRHGCFLGVWKLAELGP
ncbi:MAG: hypothetical protein HQL56_17630 [Magnetococcales bacterium]|nr:hypothetical protein [Magnetococcales bacterium]